MSTETIEQDEMTAAPADYEVKCNTCGWVKSKSTPGGCPKGHLSGFSYVEPEDPSTLPMVESVEVGGDLEAAVAEEQAQAEPKLEGEFPHPDDDEAALRLAIEIKMKDLFAEQRTGRRLDEEEEELKKEHASAKKACELQDKRIKACIDELEELYRNEPDPSKFPLFDKAKAEINAQFPAPESIAPTPPEDFAEALRRMQRDTPLADMKLKKGTVTALEEQGYRTAGDIVRKFQETTERNLALTTIKGITENRLEELVVALDKINDACQAEWDAAHPVTAEEDADDLADAERIMADPDNGTVPYADVRESILTGEDDE